MSDHIPASPALPKKNRPVFLMVLCILTFVGSGLSIVYNAGKYLTSDTSARLREKAMSDFKETLETMGTDDTRKYVIDKTIKGADVLSNPVNQKKYAVWSILASILTLGGGILMYHLKKAGFWVYTAGAMLASASAFIAFGIENIFAILTLTVTAFVIFFGIVFIVLYAINFKYPKWHSISIVYKMNYSC